MSEPFQLVSVADFERMTRAEKEKYLAALIEHLDATKHAPIADALSLADPGASADTRPGELDPP